MLDFDTSFTYNPSTDTLKVPNIEGTITEAKHATSSDTATKVTNKLTAGSKTYDGSAAVSLTKADLGLGNVDNTSDVDKVVASAKKLEGFSVGQKPLTWGHGQNENYITDLSGNHGGDIAFTESGAQMNCQIDGFFYQNDGSYRVLDTSSSIQNDKLSWYGSVVSGNVTPLGTACVPELSANRIAFLSPEAVTIEYSRDSGTTWQETQYTAVYKLLLCTSLTAILLGCPVNNSETNKYNPGLTGRTRITIFAQPYFYTAPKKILINTSGPTGLNVLIEKKQGIDGANWVTVIDTPISGWSGWSDISVADFGTLGGSTSQTDNNWYIRFTFYRTTDANNYHHICGIKIIGENNWTSASMTAKKGPMSSTGHLYTYDISANAEFPGQVKGTSLYSTGSINSDTYIYAKQDIYENGKALSQIYVQQQSGKQLSTNDYTTAEKNKLAGLSNAEALTNDEIDEAIK